MYQNGILKPGLKLIGGKTKIRPFLYKFFPEHQTYMEPFLGTGGVLIGKPESPFETASDSNEHLINYYKVLQQFPEDFWNTYELELAYLNRESNKEWWRLCFDYYRMGAIHKKNAILKAVAFYMVTKLCMNGIWRVNKAGECNSSFCGTAKGRGFWTRKHYDAVLKRIENVQFYNFDYVDFLTSQWSYTKCFIFVDPPYYDNATTYNGYRWKESDFEKLAETLHQLTGSKFLLTINDHPFIRSLFSDCQILSYQVNYSCSQTTAGRGSHGELLIANYGLEEENQKNIKTT